MDVPSQGVPIHFADLRNLPLRNPRPEQFYDECPLGIELVLILSGLSSDRPAEDHALGFFPR